MREPSTNIVWKDLSGTSTRSTTDTVVRPLLLAASSFDKGPEEMITVHGDDFYNLFGYDISYAKHGQPAIQAANSIDAGAELLLKRVVAADATLANLIVVAELTNVQTDKVDAISGAQIYVDKETGLETESTTSAGGETNEKAKINTCNIKYDVVTVEGAKSMVDVKAKVASLVTSDEASGAFRFPIYVVTDNGRGVSSKRVNFGIDYSISKNAGFPIYSFVFLGTEGKDYEYVRFAGDPDTIYLNQSYSLTMVAKALTQVKAEVASSYGAFIAKVAEFTGISEDALSSTDVLFGRDLKGSKISQITIDETGYDLTAEYGLALQSGTNGEFGDAPFGTTAYETEMKKFFKGSFDISIFDVDRHKIAACVDANYPVSVKEVIAELFNWREDGVFLRDIGLDKNSYDAIVLAAAGLTKSKFLATYIQSYDVVDKFTKHQVPVTICYSLAALIVDHLTNNVNSPFCGILNSIQIPEAIEGTINFIPIKCPTVNQKVLLTEERLNYGSYINGVFTVELQLTSQEKETQCSFINNILAIQDMMRDIRTSCPKSRYSFIDNADGTQKYAKDVRAVIDRHASKFESVTFDWTSDKVQLANKIFNATVFVTCKDYVQAEDFTICTID